MLIAATFGAGRDTDAYFLSYAAALAIGGVISQAVEVAIVPFAARELGAGRAAATRFLDSTASRIAGTAAIVWLLAMAVSWTVARPDVRPSVLRYGACFAPLVVAWCASATYSGGLISRDAIGRATGSMMGRGVGGVIALILMPRSVGLAAVAIGLGVGEIARAFWMRKELVSLVPSEGVRSAGTQPFATAATAQLAAVAANGMAPLGERIMAASLGAGAVSHLEYASRLLVVPQLVFDGALSPLLLSRWSRAAALDGRPPAARDVLAEVSRGIVLAGVIASLVWFTGSFWVRLLLHHGEFGDRDAQIVTTLLRALSIGFIASMGAVLLERFFMATAQNWTLAALSVVRLATRLGVAFATVASLGLMAFTVGFAAAECVYLGLLIVRLLVADRDRRLVGSA